MHTGIIKNCFVCFFSNSVRFIKWFIWSQNEGRYDELLREFEEILKLLFSAENIENVKQEIKKAEDIIDILKTKSELKKEFEAVRQTVTKLQIENMCNRDIDVEPSIGR